MTTALLFAILCAAILVSLLSAKQARTQSGTRFVRRSLLTKSEHRFFDQLRAAVPEGHFVFPQVGMAAVMEARGGNAQAMLAAFRRISQKRIDFCVCNPGLEPIYVVELDDHTHDPARDAARDALLMQAGIRTLRFDVRRLPAASVLRSTLREQIGAVS